MHCFNLRAAYNAATGAAVTSGFKSPTGLNEPFGLAVGGTTLYLTMQNETRPSPTKPPAA